LYYGRSSLQEKHKNQKNDKNDKNDKNGMKRESLISGKIFLTQKKSVAPCGLS
jgi:hypothetical protein